MRYSKIAALTALLSTSAHAQDVDWNSLGYFVVERCPDAIVCRDADFDAEYVSHHQLREEAERSIAWEAYQSGNDGKQAFRILLPPQRPAPIVIETEIIISQPDVVVTPPPPPPPPPADTGIPLDPKTVFACDHAPGGDRGTTFEPVGNDANNGRIDENGVVQAVKSLRRLEQLQTALGAGADALLCEGGVFEDQRYTVRVSGDIGEPNKVAMRLYKDQNPTSKIWEIENYKQIPGFDHDLVNYAMLSCYKLVNGTPRYCFNPYPLCEPGTPVACMDENTKTVLPYFRG